MSLDKTKFAAAFARSTRPDAPRYLGTRYDSTGRFLSDPGNTIVCHLQQGSDTETALLDARQAIFDMAGPGELAFTAAESLHMTLFQGILDRRRVLPYWPENMALHLPVADTTARFVERLETFRPAPDFEIEVIQALPNGLVVDGRSDADRMALRDWRDRLADLFGYRHPDHDTYEFHITFAYPITWIDDERIDAWTELLDDVTASLRARVPVMHLRAPAFCSFEDMNWFEELVPLTGLGARP